MQKAVAQCRKALTLNRDYLKAHLRIVSMLAKAKQCKAARAELEQYLLRTGPDEKKRKQAEALVAGCQG